MNPRNDVNTPTKSDKAEPPVRSWRRRLTRWAVWLLIGYVGTIVVLLALENWLVYHPTAASVDWREPPNGRVRDLELRSADGTRIHAWWCPVEGSTGALLYCHGNAGNLSQRNGSIAGLQQVLKESVLIFDYPGYGKSKGRPSEAGCYAAADAVYAWLVGGRKIPPERILIYGGSLGGGVAVDLASRKPHRALILVKTFTTMPDVGGGLYPWLPVRWLMRNRFDNLAKIGKCTRPVFIAHGTTDRLVPYGLGERLFAAANEPKYFFRMDGVDHDGPVPAAMFAALTRFLAEAERQPASPAK
jgi:fermentation-respiration switch protein FrsA (DUF1100 family)